jgi:hypothetical protein
LAYTVGVRCRAASNANPNTYMEGWITSYVGNSLTMNVDLLNGSGSHNDWNINVSGAPGLGYAGTSTSAASIVTGPVTITTQPGLAYSAGARVRLSAQADPTNWIEGLCTAYSSLTDAMTVNVDLTGGTGAFLAWNINIAGQQGIPPTIIDGGTF